MNVDGFGSNVLGSLAVVFSLAAAWLCKNKLKHSKCAFHVPCLDIETREDDQSRRSIRLDIIQELKREGVIPKPQISAPSSPSVEIVNLKVDDAGTLV